MLPFFKRNRFLILSITFIIVLIISCWLRHYNDQLLTTIAPWKIVSLQISWYFGNTEAIITSWAKVKGAAITSVQIDYYFIISYVVFLSCCILSRNRPSEIEVPSRVTKVFLWFCLLAGAADVIENYFTIGLIEGTHQSILIVSLAATIKFVVLIAVAIHILLGVRFHGFFIRYLFQAIWVYLAGILFVLIAYFLFIKVAAGQDVVIQIGEHPGPFWWSLAAIIFWAIVSWYSSRLVGEKKFKTLTPKEGEITVSDIYMHIPRLIALNSIVCIQAAILSLQSVGNLDQCQIWIFVLIHNLFYFVWHNLFTTIDRRRVHTSITALLIGAYALIAFSLIGDTPHQKWLPLVAFLLFLIELCLLWLFILRRKELNKAPAVILDMPKAVKALVPVTIKKSEGFIFGVFNVLAGIGILIYASSFFYLWLDDRMGPLAAAIFSFAILNGMSNIVTLQSITHRINFFIFLYAWALIIGNFHNPYQVRLIESKDKELVRQRPDLKTYFHNWLEKHKTVIDATDTFPVYVVIADGGASRSGYWVASVLSELEDQSSKTDTTNRFSKHVLCLSGASGGSVGTSTFYSIIRKPKEGEFLKRSQGFLKEDFLSPVVTHWFVSDLIQHFIPLKFLGIGDRADALEQGMEYFNTRNVDGAFKDPFLKITKSEGHMPILFINTTHVNQGAPAVVSSIDLKGFSKRIDVMDTVGKSSDIPFSTAVVLGARFPYVSPAGYIKNSYFVDGGYFDNTGAGIVHEMLQKLDSLYRAEALEGDDSKLYKKLNFRLLHISNSSLKPSKDTEIHPLTNDLAAPLLTVLGTYSSQTDVNNQRLISFLNKLDPKTPRYEINLYTENNEIDYPMNWVISDYNLNRMNARLDTVRLDPKFNEILTSLKPKRSQLQELPAERIVKK